MNSRLPQRHRALLMEHSENFYDIVLVHKVDGKWKASDEDSTCPLVDRRISKWDLNGSLDRSIEL